MLTSLIFAAALASTDTLTLHSGPQAIEWTGDLLTLRWGTHQIEFDAVTQDNWTDHDSISAGGFEQWDYWTIDVMYNHVLHHIPMLCHVEEWSVGGDYYVEAHCRG